MTAILANKDKVQQCIKYGNFTLHSGQTSNWICDLLLARNKFNEMMYALWPQYPVIGIEFCGALLAFSWSRWAGFLRKDGELYLPSMHNSIISLVDDVVTTEQSFLEAENILNNRGVEVGERLAIFDRRQNSTLEIKTLFAAKDFGLE